MLHQPFEGEYELTADFAEHEARDPPSSAPGVDWALQKGTEVQAAAAGWVEREGWSRAGGRFLMVNHGGGLLTYYAHLQAVWCTKKQRVECGEVLGLSGNTGRSTGPHLHFGVMMGGAWADPEKMLAGEPVVRVEQEA